MRTFDNFLLYENEFVIYLHGRFVFTNQHKNNLIEQFKSLKTDILSPLIRDNNKLVYFGGYYSQNDIYYVDQRSLKMVDLSLDSCLFFTRNTQLHYQQLFICRKKVYKRYFNDFKIDFKHLPQLNVQVSPFIQIHTLNNHNQHDIIHPYTFDNRYWKFSLEAHHDVLQSYKIEDYQTLIWNQKPNVLLLIEYNQLELIKKKISYFQKLDVNLFIFGNKQYQTPSLSVDENQLPKDFNVKEYLQLNSDIKKAPKKHYLRLGRHQHREYKLPEDFNWRRYISINQDLKKIKNENQSKLHYLKFGHYEFRNYRKNIKGTFLLKKLNEIDYLRYHGLHVNTRIMKFEQMLKKNNNLFDYILIIGKHYLDNHLKIISKICRKSKISQLIENIHLLDTYSKLSHFPLLELPRLSSKNKKKICLIYQCYYQLDNYLKILKYFYSINNNYIFHLIIVNNNSSKTLEIPEQLSDSITYLESDNTYREMSAYQTGVNYIKENDLLSTFSAYILLNETLFTNFPLYILDVLDYNHINRGVIEPIALGKVDKNHRTHNPIFNCDGWKLEKWIRSNFMIINSKVFSEMVDFNLVHYTPESIFKDNKISIDIDKGLKNKLIKWLSQERYQHYNLEQYKLKISAILNEYKLSQNLLSLCNLVPL